MSDIRKYKITKWRGVILAIFAFVVVLSGAALWLQMSMVDARNLPLLQDADIIFQTSMSSQSGAILLATYSPYTHMGLIKLTRNGPVVVEASATVRETSLQKWIDKGYQRRVTIMRMRGVSESDAAKILNKAKRYYTQPYDPYFSMDKSAQYCSELVWRAFSESGRKIGDVGRVGDLALSSGPVKTLVSQRWKSHPLCKAGKVESFDECWKRVLNEGIVTPASIAEDDQLETIYSNYP